MAGGGIIAAEYESEAARHWKFAGENGKAKKIHQKQAGIM
jgi:hypothetical protein